MLLLHPDPNVVGDFGGDEGELEMVHSFSKAMRELKQSHAKAMGTAVDSEGDNASNDEEDAKAAKRKKKKKKDAAAKKAAKKKEDAAPPKATPGP